MRVSRSNRKTENKRRKKLCCGKLGDHPRGLIEIKFCACGSFREIVINFKFRQNRLSGFGVAVGRNSPFSIILSNGLGLYNSRYCRTGRDDIIFNAILRDNKPVTLYGGCVRSTSIEL